MRDSACGHPGHMAGRWFADVLERQYDAAGQIGAFRRHCVLDIRESPWLLLIQHNTHTYKCIYMVSHRAICWSEHHEQAHGLASNMSVPAGISAVRVSESSIHG